MKGSSLSLALGAAALALMVGCSDAGEDATAYDQASIADPMPTRDPAFAPEGGRWGQRPIAPPGWGAVDPAPDPNTGVLPHGVPGSDDFDRNDFFDRGFHGFNIVDCRWGRCGDRFW
jgi:hypothetical protein